MNVIWRLLARFYLLRSNRAQKRAAVFKKRSEKFFQRLKGVWG